MKVDTTDEGLIQDCADDARIGKLVGLHSQLGEHNGPLKELVEILIEEKRDNCAARRLPSANAPATKTPKG